jgi:hypothetical protein
VNHGDVVIVKNPTLDQSDLIGGAPPRFATTSAR